MKLNNFIVNSDYTANKQKGRYTISINVPSRTLSDGSTAYRFTNSITVPSGTYFENVSISTSITSEKYAGNVVAVSPTGMWTAYISCYRTSATQYTIAVTLVGFDSVTDAFTADAVIDLSISPF